MLYLYRTKNECIYDKIKNFLNTDCEIKRTANGKPYIDGAEFSVTHTGDTALIAISDKPVGIDAEKLTVRSFNGIIKRLSAREQNEINGDAVLFLKNWVVKEAYIKMLGGTLAHDLKRLEYFNGELFYNGSKQDCNILCTQYPDLVFAVCAQSEIPRDIKILNG